MTKLTAGLIAIMITGGMLSATPAQADNGIEVDYLGTNNTLVRVTGDSRYLLMPVQDNNDDARINVIVDGKIDKTIFVKLAKSKVDYKLPLDLSGYKGHDVVLNIITSQNRSTVREAKEDACWKNFSLSDSFDTTNREKYRPAYHHTPLYGWMNDPNGMFYKDGEWHLYYQWNPYGSKWQNMTWGHSSSKDLINWEHHPAAIEPNGLGSVFSGSSVVDKENTAGFGKDAIVSLYTSADASQVQSLAHSSDNGMTFDIYPGNPVITLESEARDPNMFWDAANNRWVLTLAHALDHEMLFFTSPDLREWTLQSSFGKGIGAQDGVWECPDLFPLKVDGSDKEKWVLLCNINPGGPFGGSATQYFIGDFDGTTFKADTDTQGNIPTKWMDFGKDHYATVSFSDAPDGRRTLIGWMSNWQYAGEVPTLQFRSANTLPRDASLFTAPDGQIYLASAPSPEVDMLRDKAVRKVSSISAGATARSYSIPPLCEIDLEINPRKAATVDITLSNGNGEKVGMTYDVKAATLSFDRRQSGITDFSQDFPAVTAAPVLTADNRLSLRIFIDRSSVEVFEKEGRLAMTNLVFPTSPYDRISISTGKGKAEIKNFTVYPLSIK